MHDKNDAETKTDAIQGIHALGIVSIKQLFMTILSRMLHQQMYYSKIICHKIVNL